MKKIFIVLLLLLPVFLISALDADKEKKTVGFFLKNIYSKFSNSFNDNDPDYKVFEEKIQNIMDGEAKKFETIKFNKKYDLDFNEDGVNDLIQNVEISLEGPDDKIINMKMKISFNFGHLDFSDETFPVIKFNNGTVNLTANLSMNRDNDEGKKMDVVFNGLLNYVKDSEVKCEFNLLGNNDENDSGIFHGKIKINGIEYDYILNLSEL